VVIGEKALILDISNIYPRIIIDWTFAHLKNFMVIVVKQFDAGNVPLRK
jgi:hypothetical protein